MGVMKRMLEDELYEKRLDEEYEEQKSFCVNDRFPYQKRLCVNKDGDESFSDYWNRYTDKGYF